MWIPRVMVGGGEVEHHGGRRLYTMGMEHLKGGEQCSTKGGPQPTEVMWHRGLWGGILVQKKSNVAKR